MVAFAALSVDLDEIPCYSAIHGLPRPTDDARHAVYRTAVTRYAEVFDDLDVAATFFVIGNDTETPANQTILRDLSARGHELANHTQHHFYDFTRRGVDCIGREIRMGADSIKRVCGASPVGFRAPGYTITDDVFDALVDDGYLYDSSVFPCPLYYSAKAAAMASIRFRGRTSRSVIGDPQVLLAPANPYRAGTPYWRRGQRLLELPIGVTRGRSGRLPYIGTSLMLAGSHGAKLLSRTIVGRPFINLELHGIDLLDTQDGLEFLRPNQPDINIPVAKKRTILSDVVRTLRHHGYRFVTLATAARAFAAV